MKVYASDHNFEAFVQAISKIYATDPNYAVVIMSIIRMPEVVEALQDAKDELNKIPI